MECIYCKSEMEVGRHLSICMEFTENSDCIDGERQYYCPNCDHIETVTIFIPIEFDEIMEDF